MPAKSRSQHRLMKRCETSGKCPPGLSPQEAREYTHGQSPKGLPERNRTKKKGT